MFNNDVVTGFDVKICRLERQAAYTFRELNQLCQGTTDRVVSVSERKCDCSELVTYKIDVIATQAKTRQLQRRILQERRIFETALGGARVDEPGALVNSEKFIRRVQRIRDEFDRLTKTMQDVAFEIDSLVEDVCPRAPMLPLI